MAKSQKKTVNRKADNTARGVAEKYIETIKLSRESIKTIDAFLAVDAEKAYQRFALEWFRNNEEKIRQAGVVIPADVSDEWKINMVLSSKEKGGMGVVAGVKDPKYKKILAEINEVEELRANIKQDKISIETPFLLLNYSQKSADNGREEVDNLRFAAGNGDQTAVFAVATKEQHLNKLYLAAKELASKIMNYALNKTAEQRVIEGGFDTKEKRVDDSVDTMKEKIFAQKNEELIEREWQEFDKLSDEQKRAFNSKLGIKSTKVITNKGDFRATLIGCAESKEMETPVFCGFLDQGYKPHEAKPKGIWFLGTERIAIPGNGHIKEITAAEYDGFVEGVMVNYAKNIRLRAIEEIEAAWEEEYDEKAKLETARIITELSKSLKKVEEQINTIYRKATVNMVADYMKNYVRKSLMVAKQKKSSLKKIKDNNLENIIKELGLPPGQEKFLLDELPQMDARVRMGLSVILKNIRLLKEEEKKSIKRIKKSWK